MTRLRLLVLAVSDRCDQRCLHCGIWRGSETRGLGLAERLAVADEAVAQGVEAVLLTGGEPLLAADLWPVAERLKAGGVRLLLATNGMLLERHAASVGRLFDEVYLSLDGASPATHDGVRGVPAWERLEAGVRSLRAAAPSVHVIARCTLHAGNLHELAGVVDSARGLGLDGVSFLPLDASSGAFGGEPALRQSLVPGPGQVEAFEAAVLRLEAAGGFRDGFVLEDAAKLRRLARHLRASAGEAAFERPACDAPSWSLVVDAGGAVRPCFFHEPVGTVREGLRALRASPGYAAALRRIEAPNPTCDRCVCPKKRERPLLERLLA
jgi:MoaA/NifB/PqqE/SkfB family radical SAM enzyme